jgi:hypothetical protein
MQAENVKSNRCSTAPSFPDSRLSNVFAWGGISRASNRDCVLFEFLISVDLVSTFAESLFKPQDPIGSSCQIINER